MNDKSPKHKTQYDGPHIAWQAFTKEILWLTNFKEQKHTGHKTTIMFCCFDVPSQYSPLDNSTTAHKDHNNASNNIVGYPGRRRVSNVNHGQPQSQWTPTRGNALSEYDPSRGGGGGGVNMNQNNVNGIDCCKNNDNNKGPLVSGKCCRI